MRQIEIEWVGINRKVTANLVESKNPELCELLWQSLPYNSLQNHALVSGDHLYHLAPMGKLVYAQPKTREDRTKSPYGTVFLSHLQHLAVKYGDLTEYLSAASVGNVIPEDLPILKQAGPEIWNAVYKTKQVIEVRVTRKGEKVDKFQLPRPAKLSVASVDELVQEIHNETQRIWVTPPEEILALHEGNIRSRAGSYDQYFATLVFVNGEERPLGYCAMGGLVKSCFNSDISLDVLKQITPNFIKTPAEFLGYCGLDTLWDYVQRTMAIMPEVKTKDEYLTLMQTLSLYTNRINGWNLHYFPWKHGEEYKFDTAKPADFVPAPPPAKARPDMRA